MAFRGNQNSFLVILLLVSVSLPLSVSSTDDHFMVKGCPFDAIYSFGDYWETHSNFPSHMADFLTSAFHLPFLNPYQNSDADFRFGVNFGGAEATALTTPFEIERNAIHLTKPDTSLRHQLHWFLAHLNNIYSTHEECETKLEKALFLVGEIGSNDYRYWLFQGKPIDEVASFVPAVVQSIKESISRLIDVGARNLVVPGNLPIGCLPSYLTKFHKNDPMNYDSWNCHRGLNTLARLHNDHLRQALTELRVEHPHIQIVYADYYNAFIALLRNHVILGFDKHSLMKACCGSGGPYNFDETKMCGDGVAACSDPTKYIHWDGIHLTKEAYKYMAEGLISGSFVYPGFKWPEQLHCYM